MFQFELKTFEAAVAITLIANRGRQSPIETKGFPGGGDDHPEPEHTTRIDFNKLMNSKKEKKD